jgi:hypothetical protein
MGGAKAAARVARRCHPEPFNKRQVHAAVNSKYRQLVAMDEMLAEAERRKWIVKTSQNEWKVGDVDPD